MSITNWQVIPYQVEVLLKIAPERVLDAGVGFGRWGMLVREFCDGWNGRALPKDWAVHLEGVQPVDKNIGEVQSLFYNAIHQGDIDRIIPTLPGGWNLLILDGVLERVSRDAGERLLDWGLAHSDYVLVNVPVGSEWPHSETYETSAEWLPSAWSAADFKRFQLVRRARYLDYTGRPFGVFLLSLHDPKKLEDALFSFAPTTALEEGRESSSSALYIQALEHRNQTLEQRTQIIDRHNRALDQHIEDLKQYNRQLVDELTAIKSSRAYLLVERLRESPAKKLLVNLARILIRGAENTAAPVAETPAETGAKPPRKIAPPAIAPPGSLDEYSDADRAWLSAFQANPGPLSINNPFWRGILASAREQFEHLYLLPDELTAATAQRYARLFCEAQPPAVVIQGLPQSYYHLMTALHQLAPQLPIFLIWHGNFLQLRQDYDWDSFRLVKSLAEEGVISRVGFVKMGAAEVMQAAGLRAHFLTNLVRRIPTHPSQPLPGGPHISVWAEPDYGWNKLPYAMMGALSQLPGTEALVVNVSERSQAFGDWFNLKAEYHTQTLPNEQVLETLPRMHLNLNVSLTECAPMLPLESLSLGSPCLFGPTSHYFLDEEYLHSRLVVPYPDNSLTIARYIQQALHERDQIIRAYAAYAPDYNRRAFQMLSDFLEYPMGVGA